MSRLVVVAPGELYVEGDSVHLPAKFESGMAKYAELFPGEVVVIGRPASSPDLDNLGGRLVEMTSLTFGVVVDDDLEAGLRNLRPDIALLSLSDDHARLAGFATTTVYSAEHASRSWLAMSLAESHGPIDRLRMEIGYRRLERRMVKNVSRADGIHCNGVVAWTTYAAHSPEPLRTFDSRMTEPMIMQARSARTARNPELLRLGFSGRLTPIKGPQYAIAAAKLLASRGVQVSLDVFGDGPMRDALVSEAGPSTTFHGSIDFDEWCRLVPRLVDVMLLPHVQPDPSGTYFESAGVGVPVVGFSNETMLDLESHGFARSTSRWDERGLQEVVEAVLRQPDWLEEASARGTDFMLRHTFDRDFRARVQHLERVHRQNIR